ncbi:MAG TPA: glycine betaine ABC transporter substrate-binding protein [Terriglobia bacterium]|nr:glycine betaine ABC transporter substrate-binding protein [Terriglobia bacterium]
MKRILAITLLALTLAACGPPRKDVIVVGSKNFTEQVILGELLAQHIEKQTGLPVERRFYLGGTYICQQAMLGGRIDVYVEYTGTALTAILKQPAGHDSQEVYKTVKTQYASRFNLDVMPTLGFNDSFVLVIRGEDARKDHVKRISEAVPYAVHWRPGFGYEFMERPDGYRGLIKTYGMKFGEQPRIMDLGLLYRALFDHQVDLIAANSTDGLLEGHDLVVLKDDKNFFPPYQAVPIVRPQALKRHPAVRKALQELAGKISDAQIRRLNYQVAVEHHDLKEVVREFLRDQHLDP